MSETIHQKKYAKNPDHYKAKSRRFREENPESARASVSKWHKKNPEKVKEISRRSYRKLRDTNPELAKERARKNKLWTKYRLTPEQEKEMLDEQEHKCKICKKHENEIGRLVPDHNHITKRVRGMLCDPCNRGLGQVCESIQILKAMIKYLEEDQNQS